MNNEEKNIITPYGKGLEPKIDPITPYGKGETYYTCDGKEASSMDEVMKYNQLYYERLKDYDYSHSTAERYERRR